MARSLNKATLIGNLTRDPELRYTPRGTAVCGFSVATNRQWKTDSGETKEDAEFHRIVAWDKLAEICSQLLNKGSKVYVEGRLQTRKWQTKEGEDRQTTEVVISDMLLLDSKGGGSSSYDDSGNIDVPEDFDYSQDPEDNKQDKKKQGSGSKSKKKDSGDSEGDSSGDEANDDIPF